MAADVRMLEAGRLEDGRGPQGARGEDHGRGADDDEASCLADPDARLDTDRPSAFDDDATDRRIGQDPCTGGRGLGQVDPDARLFRPARATEPAAPAVAAGIGVASRRSRLPAERPGAAQEDRVLRRDVGRLGHPDLGFDGSDIVRPGLTGHPLEAVLGHPLGADALGRRDAGRPVDEGPTADACPGEHRHRAVPRRRQTVVEVVAIEPVELRARHGRLVRERAGFQDHDRPASPCQCRSHHAAAGTGADDDRIGVERDRSVGETLGHARAGS